MKTNFISSTWLRAFAVSVIATLLAFTVVQAATTINLNVDTGGTLTADGATLLNGDVTLGNGTGDIITIGGSATDRVAFPGTISPAVGDGVFGFEGTTVDGIVTVFNITDPTVDRVITFPDATITVNAAGDLSGATLAAGVTASSLTSLGTIGTIDVDGGTIDSVIIGGAAPSIGNFSSVNVDTTFLTMIGGADAASISGSAINTATNGTQRIAWFDNLASAQVTESIIELDNSDTDTPVTTAIKITNGGGGFTNIIDNQGTLIGATELDILDAGITFGELTNSGTLLATTVDLNGGNIDGTDIGQSAPAVGRFTAFTAGASAVTVVNIGDGGNDTVNIGSGGGDAITIGGGGDTITFGDFASFSSCSATAVGLAATCSAQSGYITTNTAALGAGLDETLTITNTLVSGTSVILVTVADDGGNGGGEIIVGNVSAGAGSFTVRMENIGASAAAGAYSITFVVLN